jgi:transposase-like protein
MIQEANTRTKTRRPRYTEEQRERIVAEYEAREGGLVEFCRAKGVSAASLFKWRREMRGEGGGGEAGAKAGWVEVPWTAGRMTERSEAGGLCVEFRRGPVAAVKIAAGADPKWTARIVEALQRGG